jgi:PHP family Zn ribbon phosphoesterase
MMNRYFGDFHIHSALSPCADDEMSPNNIVNMACLKELDIIAVADHNSAKNLPALNQLAKANDLLLIPAMEVNAKEEVHILCYFPDLTSCLTYSDYIYALLPDIPCNEAYFGKQLVYDTNDNVIAKVEKLLLSSLPLTIDDIFHDVCELGGVPVFAHIDRKHSGVLSVLGFLPQHLDIRTVEISSLSASDRFSDKFLHIPLQTLISSDAHSLNQIMERANSLILESKSAEAFLHCLKEG